MKKHTLTAKSGARVALTTDDTFTLAIGRERIESTPASLAELFSRRALKILRGKTGDQSERAKLEKAIALAS